MFLKFEFFGGSESDQRNLWRDRYPPFRLTCLLSLYTAVGLRLLGFGKFVFYFVVQVKV